MAQGINTTKRIRSANYNYDEKLCLLKLVSNYKNIIECKKTDMETWKLKERAWKEIAAKFNARAPNNIYRNIKSLKKFYENIKKTTRRNQAAKDKIETNLLTGGSCKDTRISSDPTLDLTLSLLNRTNFQGLYNPYDSDSVLFSESNVDASGSTTTQIISNAIQILNIPDEQDDTSQSVKEIAVNNEIISLSELPIATDSIWDPHKSTNKQDPLSTTLEDKSETEPSCKKRKESIPPTTPSSSDLSKQYSELANVKLEIAKLQKQFLQEEENNKKKYNDREAVLRMQSLELEIDIKKMQLKRETQETHFREQLLKLEIQIKQQQLKKLESLKILL